MQPQLLGKILLGKIDHIWAKLRRNLAKVIRFGQKQNLASPKTSDLLWLWVRTPHFGSYALGSPSLHSEDVFRDN